MRSRRLRLPEGSGARARWAQVWARLRGGEQSPARLAAAVAVGMFVGCSPLYGLHFALCAVVCLPLRLDWVLAYLSANVSNPFVAPFLLGAELEIGSWLLTGHHIGAAYARSAGIGGLVWQTWLGSLVLGGGLGLVAGALTFAVARRRARGLFERRLDFQLATTVERYAGAPLGDRLYVAAKLGRDPVTRQLLELGAGLGRVVDAGCGRGQFGLLLLDLGLARSLVGFDADARKIALAEAAARGQARFERADLTRLELPEAETVLLIDVLHYLPIAEQDALLARAARGLPRGGRLLLRELDAGAGLRARLTRALESVATLTGYNRARGPLCYRSTAEWIERLSSSGLECRLGGASPGTPFGNVLIVATRS